MRVLICGGRDWEDYKNSKAFVFSIINSLGQRVTLISGCARGADQIPIRMYNEGPKEFKDLIRFPADWDKHGRAAGPIRNQRMLDEGKPDLVIAFPGGKGTEHMKRIARKAGVEVIEYE